MVSTSTSITFYDFLNKIVIGFLLIYPFCEFGKSTATCCCQTSPDIKSIFCLLIASFISGLIFSTLVKCITSPLTNSEKLIRQARRNVIKDTKKQIDLNKKLSLRGNYYGFYYKLVNAGVLRNIPILEALESFVRQLFFVGIMYFCLPTHLLEIKQYTPSIVISICIIAAIIYFIVVCCKKSIYRFRKEKWNKFYLRTYKNVKMKCKTKYNRLCCYYINFLLESILLFVFGFCFFQIPQTRTTIVIIGWTLLPFIWYKIQMTIHESVWEGGAYVNNE